MRIPIYWLIILLTTSLGCGEPPAENTGEQQSVTDTVSLGDSVVNEPQLTHVHWKLTTMYDQTPMPPLQGTTVTNLRFDADGTIFGFGGCNTVAGTYSVTENTIKFSPETTTPVSCDRASDEALFLRMLHNATHYTLTTDSLIIFDQSHIRIGSFKSVPSLLMFH